MGAYRDIQTDVLFHDWPRWYTSGGYINQDTDTVYFAGRADGGGSYGYTIEIYLVKVDTSGGIHYDTPIVTHTGHTDFSGTKTGCGMNDRSIARVYLAMYCSMAADGGGSCTINSDADNRPGYAIPGTELTLQHIVAPIIGNLRNNSPYNGNSGVSSSTNSIAIAYDWTGGDAIDTCYYSLNDNGWHVTPTGSGYFTITGLQPGTTYKISALASNAAGNSNRLDIWVRTRYDAPTVSANITNIGLEGFIINWSSNRTMKSIRYRIDNVRDWVSSNVSSSSGTINVSNLSPATRYTVRVSGYSSDTYDGILSNEVTLTVTTLDIAKITTISDIIHGEEFTVTISNPSSSDTTLSLNVLGNGGGWEHDILSQSTGSTITVDLSESDWDEIYRRYPASNEVTLTAQLTTHGIQDYDDTEKSQTITLTGIQKTAHFGVDNAPRRVQVWVGDSSNKPRRAVCWVGADGGTKRTI